MCPSCEKTVFEMPTKSRDFSEPFFFSFDRSIAFWFELMYPEDCNVSLLNILLDYEGH